MKKKIMEMYEVREVSLASLSVANAAKLGHETNKALRILTASAKDFLEESCQELDGITSDLETIDSECKLKAYEKWGDDDKKAELEYYRLLNTNARRAEILQAQKDVWAKKIEFEFKPVFIDLAKVEKLNREEGKVFDLSTIIPSQASVKFRTAAFNRNPYMDYLDLENDGFIVYDTEPTFL